MKTSEDVIRQTGILNLPGYIEPGPMADCAGFFVQRLYPRDSTLARVVARNGEPVVSCLIQFVVNPPATPGGTSAVSLHAAMYDRSRQVVPVRPRLGEGFDDNDPRAPTPDSVALFRQSRHPLALDFPTEYVYDSAENVFRDSNGQPVTPQQILDHVYECHCRTYRRIFAWRWRVGTALRHAVRELVWRTQDGCLWLLLNLYDIELVEQRDRTLRDPFHKYRAADFRRITEAAQGYSNFFGFQSSRKSFFTNLVVLAAIYAVFYWKGPRSSFVRTIYNNTALTTAALIFAFLVADQAGPWLLIRSICLMSRLRPMVLFVVRKVPV